MNVRKPSCASKLKQHITKLNPFLRFADGIDITKTAVRLISGKGKIAWKYYGGIVKINLFMGTFVLEDVRAFREILVAPES